MKAKKLYTLDIDVAKTINLSLLNNTQRAILKTMYKISKEDLGPMCGDEILVEAVKRGLWTTRQEQSKYHTTWAYYVKEMKTMGVLEAGTKSLVSEEYLE